MIVHQYFGLQAKNVKSAKNELFWTTKHVF
jgi:hypothetical protein